ncbi:hypothetical protein DXT76_16850 [Halobacillus trueperi]|uniref:Uncharacterized protein n=1 Tax=Halobacillus trueperi TaxID=156205 RepID=A0A3D8VIH0_9BACI|nr:hypothetical protein [Halobacillus trueperi]RDY69123.1 hypothetical protein DXT76_16850 [Halobacillus trueperi]
MKKIAFTFVTMSLFFILVGCQNTSKDKEQFEKKSVAINDQTEQQKIIIVDSVDAPLPLEAKNVQSMHGKNEPQQLPNADMSKPIVITKMPVVDNKTPDVNE